MPHMEGIFINGEKAKFHPEDILDTDASQYTEEIGESVTTFLTEHITNPSNPPIDTSLTISGAAADAKETGDEISQLKSDLKFTTGVQGYSWVSNKSRNYSNPFVQATEANWESALVPCVANDRFRLKGYGGNNTRLWAFVDSEGTVLTMAAYAQVESDYIIITAPENAAYLVVNSKYTEIKGELYKGEWLLPVVNKMLPLVYCKNLVGEDTTALYPTNLASGESLTMSTSDGNPHGSNGVNLRFYDENKVQFDQWNFRNDMASRTITNNKTKTAKYMNWEYIPSGIHLQVEYGLQATSYQAYFANVDALSDIYLTAADVFNGEPYAGAYDWQTHVVSYGALFKGKSNVESFAFFTDPHVMGFGDDSRNEPKMQNYFKKVQQVFNASPCGFMVSGGDWLNNNTTMDEACYRLGYLKGVATHLLDGCHLVMGNHDTNYQGKLDSESENFTGRLDDPTIASIMYRDTDTKKAYYSFDGSNSKCYVLDTGIEHDTVEAYDWEQVDWLAHRLIKDDAEHSIIFLHIIVNNEVVQANAAVFGTLIQAYNAHSSVTLNGITYNFSQCRGRMDFWAAGHTHSDSNGTLGGVPYFITGTNSYNSDVPLIDLALADYEAKKLYLVRVGGSGTDRIIDFE